MPTYEYKCKECGIVFDRYQHFSDDPLRICPECDCEVYRVIHPVGIIFKGSGFYVTDNKGDTKALMPKSEDASGNDASSKEVSGSAVSEGAKEAAGTKKSEETAPKAD